MGKSKHRKWYDYGDEGYQNEQKKFSDRRKKKLRKIVNKTERLSDNQDGVETDRDIYGSHI
jgi:hypothetical protein